MKKLLKRILGTNTKLFLIFSNIYHFFKNIGKLPKIKPDELLNQYGKTKGDVFFIQIGAHDGVSGDLINQYILKYNWSGILVEPVPAIFKKLKENYSNHQDRLYFENSAISKNEGKLPFYRLKESKSTDIPDWYDQLGSFNKEVIISHKKWIPQFDELFFEDQVNAITFDTLIKNYNIKKVDLIQIDTEGHDFEIIKLIDFEKLNVDILIYEHSHLSKSDYLKSIKLLKIKGYNLFSYNDDTIAIRMNMVKILLSD